MLSTVLLGTPRYCAHWRHDLRRNLREPFDCQLRHVLRNFRNAVAALPHSSDDQREPDDSPFSPARSRYTEYTLLVLWCSCDGREIGRALM